MKKLIALVLSLALVLLTVGAAFAQTVGTAADNTATITVNNAAKGVEYKVVKLFGATVTGTDGGSIAYTGEIPASLASYFTKNEDTGEITATDAAKSGTELSTAAADAMKTWAQGETAVASVTSDGSKLEFVGLPYGYYVVLTSQGAGAITVTNTNPTASIIDKNTTTPTASKTVNDKDVYIGETVTYTLTFGTANYNGDKAIVKYDIEDTLPAYLSDVTVTSITIGGAAYTVSGAVPQFTDGKITIDWADKQSDGSFTSKYDNGAQIVVTYTAKVNDNIAVGDAAENKNVVTLTPYDDNGTDTPTPWSEPLHDEETIKTYGAAIKKVDENGNLLPGAEFALKGITVSGSEGKYTVTSFNASSDTYSAELACDSEGYLYILGLASDVNFQAKETKAPNGYNMVSGDFEITPIKMSEVTTYSDKVTYYDAEGNVVSEEVTGGTKTTVSANYTDLKTAANVKTVVNNKGTELPSTGGIGTTLFYLIGGLLVIGAAVVLVARRKAD